MKTTIDLADDLAATIKAKSKQEGISMRAAVHQALRLWLENKDQTATRPRIAREVGLATGKGLSPEASLKSWEEIRDLSYGQSH
ncbi:MAG: hypothetical protein ACON38_06745 [Akkermansiaceae bacterium]